MSENFNSELARSLIDRYQIPAQETPCIVFDDLNEEHRQHYISLVNMSEIERRDFFYACAEIIKTHVESKRTTSPGIWREKVIGSIFNSAQIKKYGRKLLKLVPVASSVTKIIGGGGHHPH
jgi:hypothetical protein